MQMLKYYKLSFTICDKQLYVNVTLHLLKSRIIVLPTKNTYLFYKRLDHMAILILLHAKLIRHYNEERDD